ncbi:MAG: HD domain-containing protein [Saprospiraceae bacterium]
MQFQFLNHEQKIINIIAKAGRSLGCPTFLIGGFVRDRFLDRDSKDIDVVCVGSGIALAQKVAELLELGTNVTIFKRFGTAMLTYGNLELEFVGARKESYSHDSRNPVVEDGTLEDDQNRRDFTINALAVDLTEEKFGEVIDPFNGLLDLKNKIIRTPLEPNKTFSDDPLRMMRAIRFATQLDFEIEANTWEGLKCNSYRLEIISEERIQGELSKIIRDPKPSVGFIMLEESGLLQEFLPELTALKGIEYKDGRGHKDNFYHTLQVLDNLCEVSNDYWLRWAAILHDIGKPRSKRYLEDMGWTFHGHEVIGERMVPKLFKRMRLPLDNKMKFVQKMVALHQRPISLTKEIVTDSAIRRLIFDAGDDLDKLLVLCNADITSKNKSKVERYKKNYDFVKERIVEVEERDHLRNWQPPISGELIMSTFNIPPSKEVGTIKNAIREAILDGDIPNDYEAALAFMIDKGKKIGLELNL